jgi:hypothetical protein
LNIVFVCQKGELELKALLLAWSLRKTHGLAVNLIAACPEYKDWSDLSPITLSVLKELSVDIKKFTPMFGSDYPIGNKISALGLLPENAVGCFLDSDMLSLSFWGLEGVLKNNDSVAKPADVGTWGNLDSWQKVYGALGMKLPVRRVRLTVSNQLTLPYFNAGFVATKIPQTLSLEWSKNASLLNAGELNLQDKYPWLDQISLPLAMQKIGSWSPVSEYFNYPAHLRSLGEQVVGMCHYHTPGVILREPRLRVMFEQALEEYPHLSQLAQQFDNWKALLGCRLPYVSYKDSQRNFIITGIPRSGTSYLTSVLDEQKNWLVINEPNETFAHLQTRTDASGLALYYAECRERILSGQPIANKVKDGKVIEDTAIIDQQELYHPQLHRSDFWLGSKNTLAYLASLENLVKLDWPIIAMVRNPLDTLASWRNTFTHLAEARVSTFPIAHPNFIAWSTGQRQALLEIDEQPEASMRRVLLWRFLARTILDQESKIQLWRYEDVVGNPGELLAGLNRKMNFLGPIVAPKTNIKTRQKDYDLEEREMLFDLCFEEMKSFKYN